MIRRMEEPIENQPPVSPDFGITAAGLLAAAALLLAIYGVCVACGFVTVAPVVGGDAYNFIIAGIRGLAWISAGVVSALLAIIVFAFSRP